MNKVILNDCLKTMKMMEDESVDVIYLDPPFFTQRKQAGRLKNSEKILEFNDLWKSIDEYMEFMKARLVEMRRVLKKTGSIFLHCDKTASHYLRVLLDQVFGMDKFQSEIIWAYRRWSNSKKGLLNAHQNIYFYSKTNNFKFNTLYTDYSATTNIDQILQQRERDKNGKCVYKKDKNGNIVSEREKKGVPLSDIWEIPFLNPKAKERVGYPTQKPILLIERIIKISSDEGDVILDPFCGSGTTLVAAELLKRNYIGIDISRDAVEITKSRLKNPIKTESVLLNDGIEKYQNKTQDELNILKSIGAVPVQRNSGIDGFILNKKTNQTIAIKIQKDGENLLEAKRKLIEASKNKDCQYKVLIQNENAEQQIPSNSTDSTDHDVVIINTYKNILKDAIVNFKERP